VDRVLIVVPERSAGWGSGRINPLVEAGEWQSKAALSAVGVFADVVSEEALLAGTGSKDELIVLASPGAALRTRVEERLRTTGGRLLIANDHSDGSSLRSVWRTRVLRGSSGGLLLKLRGTPRHARRSLRHVLSGARPFTVLRPEDGEQVLARWGRNGPAALVVRRREGLTSWRSGFSLDHLDTLGLEEMLGILEVVKPSGMCFPDPVPGKGRAVVLLLHDVEEPLVGDSRGIETVIAGIEASLEAEKRHGFSSTYNLVGSFGQKIPRLIRRIVEEGHELGSHGATHRVMADLDPESLQREVVEAEESIEQICGSRVRGFRSPRSRWSVQLLECLATGGYQWNAEADVSPFPYQVPRRRASSLLRIPVAIDDWDFVKLGRSPRQVLAMWMKEVKWAMERRCWVGVGSHPSVLGIDPDRTTMFSDFLAWLAAEKVVVMTHAEAASWWKSRLNGWGDDREPRDQCNQKET